MDFDVVVGFLMSWAMSKLHRVAKRADDEVDGVVDAGMDRLHDLVSDKLAGDKALETLETEAEEFGETSGLTRKRLAQSLDTATKQDPDFAAQLAALVRELQAGASGPGVVIGGDVHAEGGSLAAGQITGGVTFSGQPPHPTQPGR